MIDFILHIDQYLEDIVLNYGHYIYAILFLIVFLETGLVIVPFLPGDSLLFVAGALAGNGTLNLAAIMAVFIVAAILGDAFNYYIGSRVGKQMKNMRSAKYVEKEDMSKSEAFFKKHGAKTIIIARFVPVVRRFAPFIAGTTHMKYSRFLIYNVVGAILWVVTFVTAGYFFGNIPFIKDRIVLISIGFVLIALVVILIMNAREKISENHNKKE